MRFKVISHIGQSQYSGILPQKYIRRFCNVSQSLHERSESFGLSGLPACPRICTLSAYGKEVICSCPQCESMPEADFVLILKGMITHHNSITQRTYVWTYNYRQAPGSWCLFFTCRKIYRHSLWIFVRLV